LSELSCVAGCPVGEQLEASIIPETGAARQKLPFVVPLLAVGTFLMCTTEYIIAGLLSEISADHTAPLLRSVFRSRSSRSG
jgi:hypothetical protein